MPPKLYAIPNYKGKPGKKDPFEATAQLNMHQGSFIPAADALFMNTKAAQSPLPYDPLHDPTEAVLKMRMDQDHLEAESPENITYNLKNKIERIEREPKSRKDRLKKDFEGHRYAASLVEDSLRGIQREYRPFEKKEEPNDEPKLYETLEHIANYAVSTSRKRRLKNRKL